MASYAARKNKYGEIISYQIKVSRGRDLVTGKQRTPYTTTYTPPEGWSPKSVERELLRTMGEFESACLRGEIRTREELRAAELLRRQQERQRPSFAQYAEVYLREREAAIAKNTLQRYRSTLGRAGDYFGDMQLAQVTTLDVKAYLAHIQTENLNRRTGGRLSYSTVLCDYQCLNTFFESALESGVIERNPMERTKPPRRPKDDPKKEPQALTEQQIKRILRCLEAEPLKWRALVLLLIDSGCRIGEAIGLRWSDIDFATGEVQIVRNAQNSKGYGVYITTPKSGKPRTIFLNPAPLAVLQKWQAEQAETLARAGRSNSGFCFTARNGEMMHPDCPDQYLRKTLGPRCDIPGLHPHMFRHTMATLTIAGGGDIVSVSKKLGHSSPAITLSVYSHANAEAQRRANEILAQSIYGDMDAGL